VIPNVSTTGPCGGAGLPVPCVGSHSKNETDAMILEPGCKYVCRAVAGGVYDEHNRAVILLADSIALFHRR
jgi:hypothetical protein